MRALLLSLIPAAGLALTFAPTEGTTATKRFTEATTWSLTDVTQVFDGQELPVDELNGFDCDFERTLEFVDTYGPVREGRIRGLRREVSQAFVSADMEMRTPMGDLPLEFAAETDLDGEVLLFAADGDDDELTVTLESEEDPDSLQGVDVDADLLGLLPTGEVEVGDSWSVADENLPSLFMPGGDLSLLPGAAPELPGDGMEATDLLASGQLSLAYPWEVEGGSVDAKWESTIEEDGDEFARIELTAELELSADRTELLAAMCASAGVVSEREDQTFEANWTLEGKGELMWNLTAGHFASLELTLEGEAEIILSWGEPMGGGMTVPVDIIANVSTETTLTASAE